MIATFKFFDWDFQTRLGISQKEMHALLSAWSNINDADDNSRECLAVNNALNDLLNGVGISDEQALELVGADRTELKRIYQKWAAARGWAHTGIR